MRHVDPVVVAVALAVALDVCGTPMQALGHSSSLGKASVVSIDREGFLQGCRNPVDLAECRLAVRVDTRIREAKTTQGARHSLESGVRTYRTRLDPT